jgi:rhomboid protease GluP
MKTYLEKLRLIYLPFLIIAVCFVLSYTLLNWLLFVKIDRFQLKDDVVRFWIPFALPWIPVLIWLKPRIRLLSFKGRNQDRLPFTYQFVAVLAIAVITIIAQEYMVTATGKLVNLQNVEQIQKDKAKYYTISNYYIDKANTGVHYKWVVSGKYNDNLTFTGYYALPVFNTIDDTLQETSVAWLGIKYSKMVSNKLESEEKDRLYDEFYNQTQKRFEEEEVPQFIYLDRLGYTDERAGFEKAVKRSIMAPVEKPIILKPVNEPFSKRNGDRPAWTFGSFGIIDAIFLIMILVPAFDEKEMDKFLNGKTSASSNELKEALQFLKPREGYFITPIFIDINIALFIAMIFSGMNPVNFQADDLLNWGGNFRPYVLRGEWWRLLTSVFLHGGLMHLVANMVGLGLLGVILEPVLGKRKYLLCYLATGLLASIASIYWHSQTVSVGASGAIFGLSGIFLALLLRKCFPPEFSKGFLTGILLFIGFNLVMGFTGGIDNAAHIGGLLSGLVIGYVLSFKLQKKQPDNLKVLGNPIEEV